MRTGLSAAPELDVEAIVGDTANQKDRQAKLSQAAFEAVTNEYLRIEAAIEDPYKGTADGFAQPWLS